MPKSKLLEGTQSIDKAIAGRLKTLRVQRGMSQTQLGEAVKITFQQVQKYEHGTNRISCSRLWQFANLLGVNDINYFFQDLQSHDADALPPVEIDATAIKLSALLASVNQKMKARIMALVKTLAENGNGDS